MMAVIKHLLSLLSLCLPRALREYDRRKREAVRQAVVTGDKVKVNATLDKYLGCCFLAVALSMAGCTTDYTVVTADRECKPIVYENVEGWFVPNAVMLDVLDKLGEKE